MMKKAAMADDLKNRHHVTSWAGATLETELPPLRARKAQMQGCLRDELARRKALLASVNEARVKRGLPPHPSEDRDAQVARSLSAGMALL